MIMYAHKRCTFRETKILSHNTGATQMQTSLYNAKKSLYIQQIDQ